MWHRPLAGLQRTAAAAAVMLVLLAIAAAATGRGGRTGAPPGTGAVSAIGHHALVVAVVVLFPILAVAGLILVLYVQIMKRRERDPEVLRRRRQGRVVALALLAIALGLLIYKLRHPTWNPLGFLHLKNPFSNLANNHGRPQFQHPHGGGGAISSTDWMLAAIVWVLLVVVAVAVFARVRARRDEVEPPAIPEAADDADDLGLDAVRRERNPRRAVIAAYALMERLMARDGLARGPHEAPMEYLGRVTLHGHRGAGSVHRLTALFQRARFSHRPVDEEMRQRAIAAVEELDPGPGGAG
jgi:phosphatidylglycerophosphate synthase